MKILKFIKWLLKSIILGLAIIFIFNIIGAYFSLNIPVNIYTIAIVGTLRIPGLVMILIFLIL
ncbi:MAG: pro-sigmaK processing inhibitor BofA family protein [Bacilli bacterium]|nr:pro-sigmaK processing inhibitor BofA family protein [Staphylococcus sp.]